MESLTIEIIDPKARKILEGLADMKLINMSEKIDDEEADENSWNSLTKEQQEGIFKAMNQIENGEGIPHEQIMSEFLNKYQNG